MALRQTVVVAAGLAMACASGCAAQDDKKKPSTQDVTQAVKDFIEVRELESVDTLRSGSSDRWYEIGNEYLVYQARRDEFLIAFTRRCHELNDNTHIKVDKRWDSNVLRARFDTIRGCRIDKIYALDEAEAAELKNIGEVPGSRN